MPTPCRVCSHLARPEIDARLCQHVVNVAQLAREYGVPWKSMAAHRDQHLPTFLKVYGSAADLPSLGELHAEALRVYMTTLDELGRAQAGVLLDITDDGKEHRQVSHTAIARLLDSARRSVDQLARLAADAGEEKDRPAGMAHGELSARIAAQLEGLQRPLPTLPVHNDAPPTLDPMHPVALTPMRDVAYPGADEEAATTPPGGLGGGAGAPEPLEIPLDAAVPLESLPGLRDHPALQQLLHSDARTRMGTPQVEGDAEVLLYVPHPDYPGSKAASVEERIAEGYPDVPISLEDLKANATVVAKALAGLRTPTLGASPPPPDE